MNVDLLVAAPVAVAAASFGALTAIRKYIPGAFNLAKRPPPEAVDPASWGAGEAARIARGEQAATAMRQFLAPAFDVARAEYLAKLGEIAARPLTNDMRAGMEKLALAVKVIDEVRQQIESLVTDAALARAGKVDADRMANLPAEKRKWLGY